MFDAIPAKERSAIRIPMEVAVAPDGARVAITVQEMDYEADERHTAVYTAPTDGSVPAHRLTRVTGASMPRWSPDGTQLGVIATREEDLARRVGYDDDEEDEAEGDGDDDPKAQLWVFDLERGGDARQVTDRDRGVRSFDWAPDGERVVISARDPTDEEAEYLDRREEGGPIETERLQHKFDGMGYLDAVTSYLFVVDVETGDSRRLDEAYGAGAFEPMSGLQPRWSPAGDRIAFLRCGDERPDDSGVMDVYLADVGSGEVDRLTDAGLAIIGPTWNADGSSLVVAGRDPDNWYRPIDVVLVDADDGSTHTLTEALDATVSWFGRPRFLDDGSVLASVGEAGWTRLYRVPLDGDPAPLSGAVDRDASVRHFDGANGIVAYIRTDPAAGIDVLADALDGAGGVDPTRLTAFNEGFVDDHPAPRFTRMETDHAGVTVESMVYHPPSFDPDDPEPHPGILWMHGGPASYDDPEFDFDLWYFTSRGYLVCKPNYRGSTSYGTAFAETLRGRWGTVEVEDVLAVADDLLERDWIDPDRQFATGLSYGGIATGYLVTETDRFAAAAAEHGIYDLLAEYGTSDSHIWLAKEFGLPWEDTETYEAGSAIRDVDDVDTPTLLTAGTADWRCPPSQSEQFYVSLRKRDVPAKLVMYPDEHHAISAPQRAEHRLEAIEAWFERHDAAAE